MFTHTHRCTRTSSSSNWLARAEVSDQQCEHHQAGVDHIGRDKSTSEYDFKTRLHRSALIYPRLEVGHRCWLSPIVAWLRVSSPTHAKAVGMEVEVSRTVTARPRQTTTKLYGCCLMHSGAGVLKHGGAFPKLLRQHHTKISPCAATIGFPSTGSKQPRRRVVSSHL